MTDKDYLDSMVPPDDEDMQPHLEMLEETGTAEDAAPAAAPVESWGFDINDPTLFLRDESFDEEAFTQAQELQDAETADIVTHKALEEAVKRWFEQQRSFSTAMVEGLFFRGSLAAIYGASHTGKTLLAMAIAQCLSMGEPFGDLGVRQSPVLYMNAESQGDYNKRMQAICQGWGIEANPMFRVIHGAFDVRSALQRELLIRALPIVFGENHRPPLIVMDTLAQHLSGVPGEPIDENSAKDMGQYIYGLRDLAERTNGCVVLVAHAGKDDERGIRGSSSLRAALDTELRTRSVRRPEDDRQILIQTTLTKQRMCDAMEDACYPLQKILLKDTGGYAEKMIDDDDVMVKRDVVDGQFNREVAPSNQSAYLIPSPEPVPDLTSDIKKDKPVAKKPVISEKNVERAENVRRILMDYLNGESERAAIGRIWREEGFKVGELSAALRDAITLEIIHSPDGRMYKSSISPSSVGHIGGVRDAKNLPKEEF